MTKEFARVDSLGKFIDNVGKLREYWGLPKHKELWFRGEAKDYGKTRLRPELYRPANDTSPLKPISKLLDIENELHEEFKRNAVEYEKEADDEWDWDSYFLMQHHEGPTRLLDWSDGALIALHFALRDKSCDNCDAYVYVLEAYRLSQKLNKLPEIKIAIKEWEKYVENHPSEKLEADAWDGLYLPNFNEDRLEVDVPPTPLVLDIAHITRRIAAQRSRFILFGQDPEWLANEFAREDSLIKAIIIPQEYKSRLRQELRDCGITESVIYPDLDGIGREMKQLWEDRRVAREENA